MSCEKPCQSCILTRLDVPEFWVHQMEDQRIKPDDVYDAVRLAEQPNGAAIEAALRLPRPMRCGVLRAILPTPPEETWLSRPLALCPEMGAVALLYAGEPLPDTPDTSVKIIN